MREDMKGKRERVKHTALRGQWAIHGRLYGARRCVQVCHICIYLSQFLVKGSNLDNLRPTRPHQEMFIFLLVTLIWIDLWVYIRWNRATLHQISCINQSDGPLARRLFLHYLERLGGLHVDDCARMSDHDIREWSTQFDILRRFLNPHS